VSEQSIRPLIGRLHLDSPSWIEEIAEGIAQHVEPEDGQADGDAGNTAIHGAWSM
jgi:hypothetical protein